MQTPRPNLFIVGAPKCGTTSLYHYLNQHPQVYLAEKKEPHFFATDFQRASDQLHGEAKYLLVREESQYLGLFSAHAGEPVVGEASTSYLYSEEAAASIARFAPDARVIICLREPYRLLASWHSYLLHGLEETAEDLLQALGLESGRSGESGPAQSLPRSVHYPQRLFYRRMLRLDQQIARYLEHFSRERVHFVFLEELQKSPLDVYRGVLRFLEVDDDFVPDFAIQNARRVRRSRVLSGFQREVIGRLGRGSKPALLKRFTPKPVKRLAYGALTLVDGLLHRVNSVSDSAYPRVGPDALPADVKDLLAEQVDAIARLTGRDLSVLWGPRDPSAAD